MKIRPLHDRILVKRTEEPSKTKSGLFLPEAAKEKPANASMKSGVEPQRVHVLRNGKPRRVQVVTGLSDGKFTEVSGEGLKEGDEVVTGEGQPGQKNGGGQRWGGGPPR